ncbi:MAG: guanylate kinase [Firmicutes bacterium]|nr:guanylate kinase [Bacillota bacterium]
MMKKGRLIVISGPAGTGKGTVVNGLMERERYALSVSATTRAPRGFEQDGINYFFKTVEEFEEMIKNGEFLEYAKFVDNYYGTPKKYVLDKLEEGKNVLLEIEVQGALQVKKNYPDATLIFLLPPSMDELESRLRGRATDSEETILKRLARAEEEMSYKDKYDYQVVNLEVEQAVEEIENIINNLK